MTKAISKYLSHYSEQEIKYIEGFPDQSYDHVLIIPAYSESPDFLSRLLETTFSKTFLLILVLNHPDSLSKAQLQEVLPCDSQIFNFLGVPFWTSGPLSLHKLFAFDVLLVNRTGENSIAAKSGVGLARKIGADIALALFTSNKINSFWFGATDADTRLPKDYFQAEFLNRSIACIYPFEHVSDNTEISEATQLYEKSIRHYVAGLTNAGSSYAFHTIGSLMAINFDAYASVRGYPKRAAGEDFYLINKLAKIGVIESLDRPRVLIEPRISNRTPFGTGPAVNKLLDSADMLAEPVFYNPRIFDQLAIVLKCFKAKDLQDLEVRVKALPSEARETLGRLKVNKMLQAAQRQKYQKVQLDKHIDDWFDGFRTLKFVHLMRDNYFPSLGYRDLFHKKCC